VDYLLDDSGVIESRNKQIVLRPLDVNRANKEKLMWQIVNIGVPVFLLVVFGIVKNVLRRRKYGNK
jgi:ABC-2 type transport system permease protein